MRVLGFSEMWPKLQQDEFTTFRFPRKDKDWFVSETVKVVYQPRRKGGGDFLGVAQIVDKVSRGVYFRSLFADRISEVEAIADGFDSLEDMQRWLRRAHGDQRIAEELMHKLTLRWEKRE